MVIFLFLIGWWYYFRLHLTVLSSENSTARLWVIHTYCMVVKSVKSCMRLRLKGTGFPVIETC